MKYIIPRFVRTRAVELKKLPDGTWVLVCSCGLFKMMGYACRHMYKVLKRDPKTSDAIVRWQNGYGEDYGRLRRRVKSQLLERRIMKKFARFVGVCIGMRSVNDGSCLNIKWERRFIVVISTKIH